MMRIQDDPGLLDQMMAAASQAPEVYRPGPHWSQQSNRILSGIRRFGVSEFRRHPEIAKGYCDFPRGYDPTIKWDPTLLRTKFKLLLGRLPVFRQILKDHRTRVEGLARLVDFFQARYYESAHGQTIRDLAGRFTLPDTTVGGSAANFTVDGRPYSTPVLYVGTQYLRAFWGDAVTDFRATKDRSEIAFRNDDSREIICIAPWQIERVAFSLDVFWNSASFPEMPQAVVENYAKHIKRFAHAGSRLCLVLNAPDDGRIAGQSNAGQVRSAFAPEFSFAQLPTPPDHLDSIHFFVGRQAATRQAR